MVSGGDEMDGVTKRSMIKFEKRVGLRLKTSKIVENFIAFDNVKLKAPELGIYTCTLLHGRLYILN